MDAGPLQARWQTNVGPACHLSARIHHFSVGDEAHKRVSAGLFVLLKHRRRRRASKPRHRSQSRQFNARPFDASADFANVQSIDPLTPADGAEYSPAADQAGRMMDRDICVCGIDRKLQPAAIK